ncbi:MAG: penicillin-binding protein 2 [Legionellales bacterium]|nr:penicillin-binding protein 2 [Legionellales bacterium]
MLVLLARIVYLTVYERTFLLKQGNARTVRVIDIPAHRGMILDRNHQPLAISTPVYSVWIDPHQFSLQDTQIPALANLLQESIKQIQATINDKSKSDFVYLKRQLSPDIADQIKALHIPGIYFQQNYKRYYPEADAVAPLLGMTNIDDQGQEGLELAYNNLLQGVPGKERVLVDLYGHVVAVQGIVQPARPGHNLILSIDHRIQYLAYSVLSKAVADNKAESGSIVIMDIKTGEILAMVNAPSYNPNTRPKYRNNNYRNLAVTDQFEPGSTMKTFAVANALDNGKYNANTMVDTNPGWMILNGHRVQDEENLGNINVTTILQRSSNMGITKLTLSMPPNSLWNLLHKEGFGQSTHSGFPGEALGSLVKPRKWSDIALATLSFGYGVSATMLQLTQAYAMIGNEGVKHPVSLLKIDKPSASEPVLKKKVAIELINIMQSVTAKGGSGFPARIPGYNVAGKTGTAWIMGAHGYERKHFNALFIGIVPASKPRIVAAIVIKDPQAGHHQGGQVAAPVFSEVMTAVLRDLNIPPDDLTQKGKPDEIKPVVPKPH